MGFGELGLCMNAFFYACGNVIMLAMTLGLKWQHVVCVMSVTWSLVAKFGSKFWSKRTENVLYCFESNACGDKVGSKFWREVGWLLIIIENIFKLGFIMIIALSFLLMGKRDNERNR